MQGAVSVPWPSSLAATDAHRRSHGHTRAILPIWASVSAWVYGLSQSSGDTAKTTSNGAVASRTTAGVTAQAEVTNQPTKPQATATPAKPLTLEEKIKQALPESMSDVTVTTDDAINFKTDADVKGKKDVTIEANHTGTYWDTRSTKQATWKEATDIIKKVFPMDSTIDGIIIINEVPVTTAYGKKQKDMLTTISISRDTYNQIEFNNFDDKNIPTIADKYVENPNIRD
jgi:hypothetical protein